MCQFQISVRRAWAVSCLSVWAAAASASPWGSPPGTPAPDPDIFPPARLAQPAEGIALDDLQASRIEPGLTKDQVRFLLGAPHFDAGILDVTEWNYLIQRRRDSLLEPCQLKLSFYKERFNDPYRIARIAWKPQSCAFADPPPPTDP